MPSEAEPSRTPNSADLQPKPVHQHIEHAPEQPTPTSHLESADDASTPEPNPNNAAERQAASRAERRAAKQAVMARLSIARASAEEQLSSFRAWSAATALSALAGQVITHNHPDMPLWARIAGATSIAIPMGLSGYHSYRYHKAKDEVHDLEEL